MSTQPYAEIAMNIIPSTFDEHKIPYTILKKNAGELNTELSVIVLNRGAKYYLFSLFQNLISIGLNSIVFVGNSKRNLEFESLSAEFPDIKFVTPAEEITTGEMINLGISEVSSEYVLVIWSDSRLMQSYSFDDLLKKLHQKNYICVAPFLIDENNVPLPVQNVPSISASNFTTEQFPVKFDFTKTIYMFDFIGIYNRIKFIDAGGFDYTIKNPYWQNLDFGFRSHLYGSEIIISNNFKIKYASETPIENVSADDSYMTFYLKNLALSLGNNGIELSWKMFFHYAKKSGLNLFNAYKYFAKAAAWVKLNNKKINQEPAKLISKWEPLV